MVNTNNLHKQQYCRTHGALNNNKKMSVVISSMKMTFGGRTCHVEEIWRKQRGCRSLPFLFSMGIPNVTQRNESENQSDKKVIWQKKMTSRVAAGRTSPSSYLSLDHDRIRNGRRFVWLKKVPEFNLSWHEKVFDHQ